jgi:hypothetical protein
MRIILNNNLIVWVMLIFLFIVVGLGILDVLRVKKRIKNFFNGSKARDLEELLAQEIKRVKNLEIAMGKIVKDHESTKGIALRSIHKTGVVRFNPFNDMGGDQSFVAAFLDSENSGVILSNLYSREGSRIYAKPIINGKSQYALSDEEKAAIKKAIGEDN